MLGGNFRKFGCASKGISATFCALAFCANCGFTQSSNAKHTHRLFIRPPILSHPRPLHNAISRRAAEPQSNAKKKNLKTFSLRYSAALRLRELKLPSQDRVIQSTERHFQEILRQ